MPPRFPYPVFMLLTAVTLKASSPAGLGARPGAPGGPGAAKSDASQQLLLIAPSMLDYANAERHAEFAFRMHRPLTHLVRWLPPAATTDGKLTMATTLLPYGHSPAANGLPTFGEMTKFIGQSIKQTTRVSMKMFHLHVTPAFIDPPALANVGPIEPVEPASGAASTAAAAAPFSSFGASASAASAASAASGRLPDMAITTLDADMPNIQVTTDLAGLLGSPVRAALLQRAYRRWAQKHTPPPVTAITPIDNMARLRL
jgi:hypothetical protein